MANTTSSDQGSIRSNGGRSPARCEPPPGRRGHLGQSVHQPGHGFLPSRRRTFAPGVREEEVVRLAAPVSFPWLFDAGICGSKLELLIEETQIEVETVLQMAALGFATLQRIAHDHEEILSGTVAAIRDRSCEAIDSGTDNPLCPRVPPGAPLAIATGVYQSLDEMVAVIGEAHRELSDIHIERISIWASTLQRLLEWC